ncbi:MAG: hypothetical protein HRU20_10920 [Pseudomonadales bacterium]|nr:hypothetical protein [Pseudomonadales bacterium]
MSTYLLSYQHYRYLKISLILAMIYGVLYYLQTDVEPPSGASTIGYILGFASAVLILILLLLGVRKRSFHYQPGKMQGWVSAHIYLGLLLMVCATLHTGLQWGWNIHSLTYALLCLVVLSGLTGLYAYIVFPQYLGEEFMHQFNLQRLQEIDDEAMRLTQNWRPESEQENQFARLLELNVYAAISGCQLGGSAWSQITAQDESQRLTFESEDILLPADNHQQQSLISYISQNLSRYQSQHQAQGNIDLLQQLLTLITEKRQMLNDLRQVIRIKAFLQLWLYVHIPLSLVLLTALILHILSVFLYW